jgi:hypothetical protein
MPRSDRLDAVTVLPKEGYDTSCQSRIIFRYQQSTHGFVEYA